MCVRVQHLCRFVRNLVSNLIDMAEIARHIMRMSGA